MVFLACVGCWFFFAGGGGVVDFIKQSVQMSQGKRLLQGSSIKWDLGFRCYTSF